MIVSSFGQITPKTAHDHALRPLCPNLRRKMPMEAALAVPMWGCVNAFTPDPG
jgi:hypothetical protein